MAIMQSTDTARKTPTIHTGVNFKSPFSHFSSMNELLVDLKKGEEDIRQGRCIDGRASVKGLRARFGL